MRVSAGYLPELLELDESSGLLRWRAREEITHFVKAWNTKYAGKPALRSKGKRYYEGRINDRLYLAHTVVYAMYNGDWAEGDVDHIDGNGFNNSPSNLRDVPHVINMRNNKKRTDNTSGYTGVWHLPNGKCRAMVGGKHIGVFLTKQQAAAARRDYLAANGYTARHGEYH